LPIGVYDHTTVLPPKICPVCGILFKKPRSTAKFCSRACMNIAFSHVGLDKVCAYCGKKFHAKRESAQFCSEECFFNVLHEDKKNRAGIERICNKCGRILAGNSEKCKCANGDSSLGFANGREFISGQEKVAGIYLISNKKTGEGYVGSSINVVDRCNRHKIKLRNGQHHSRFLQRSWDKYGEDAFLFYLLEAVDEPRALVGREQYYIDTLRPSYNANPIATTMLGFKHSEETKAKVSRGGIGKHSHAPLSEEIRAKLSIALKGRPSKKKGQQWSEQRRRAYERWKQSRDGRGN
jgi:group I intron endonuclease